jgi:hypothetical protein
MLPRPHASALFAGASAPPFERDKMWSRIVSATPHQISDAT